MAGVVMTCVQSAQDSGTGGGVCPESGTTTVNVIMWTELESDSHYTGTGLGPVQGPNV